MVESSTLFLAANALFLGLKHGVDWDHCAAIFDIVCGTYPRSAAAPLSTTAVFASMFYALGHGLLVVMLGCVAIFFSSVLPEAFDPIMERIVGVTLLLLSLLALCSTFSSFRAQDSNSLPVSRGGILIYLINKAISFLQTRKAVKLKRMQESGTCNNGTAFSIGAVHAIGAETGSQILLLTAVTGKDHLSGVLMLFAFVLGLLLSNLGLAITSAAGFALSNKARAALFALGLITSLFSVAVGISFCLGSSDKLPSF